MRGGGIVGGARAWWPTTKPRFTPRGERARRAAAAHTSGSSVGEIEAGALDGGRRRRRGCRSRLDRPVAGRDRGPPAASHEQLGVGPADRSRFASVARLSVHRHDEVVARSRAGDVEEPQLLVESHLLVDRLVQFEVRGLHAASRASPRSRPRRGTTPARRGSPVCAAVVVPEQITIGNSRPLAPWIVRMRTASSSVSGSTASTTRAPSVPCSSAHAR